MLHKVTALSLQKKNRQRINVFLDGEYAFGLDRVVAGWLEIGQEISDERILELKQQDARETAFQSALRLLNYRPRTEAEMRARLQKKAYTMEDIEAVIERLKHSQLLDDRRFTLEWIDNRAALKPRSRRALEYELRQHGVEREIIQEALVEVDDEQLAYLAAARQTRKYQDLEWNEFRIKLARYLNQRGFQYETIKEVTTRIWNELHEAGYTIQS